MLKVISKKPHNAALKSDNPEFSSLVFYMIPNNNYFYSQSRFKPPDNFILFKSLKKSNKLRRSDDFLGFI